MVTFLPSYMMDVESSRTYVDQLFSTEQEKCLEAVVQLKNSVIGSNKQKTQVLQMGVVPRLMAFLLDEGSTTELLVATTVVLGSLAKGTQEHVRSLMDSGIVPLLLKGLCHGSMPYVEACLRCLRTIFVNPAAYGDILYQDSQVMCQLMALVSYSTCTQECIANIVAFTCKTVDHQIVLYNSGAIPALIPLLSCNIYKVLMPTLKCLAAICHHNEEVSAAIAAASYNGENVIDTIAKQLTRDKTPQMQIACAKCLTYISRTGALGADDPRIIFKTLPALVRMCKKDQAIEDRVDAAESLAYLTEVDSQLQRIASFSDHLITTLSEFLKYEHSPEPSTIIRGNQIYVHKLDDGLVVSEMKQAAFLAFASLGANDEDIRKKIRKVRDKKTSDLIIESSDDKIIETDSLMDQVVSSLSDPSIKVRLAAVRCLHSLSRSVQQLRTGFQDHAVWKPLMKLLQNAPDEVLRVASSTLCNLLLEFSPSKEPILESGAIDLLCKLTRREDPALRLNGIWALMNMAFQAEQKIKSNILNTLGTDQIFHLLSDPDVNILMKTLGLLRNLLSTKPHIEHIMGLHGKQIMQAVILILEGDHSIEVKEQAICILANIADGDYAKDFIMSNEDVLKKLMNYMMHPNVKLQVAATFCISNLVWTEEEGAIERQVKLRELGVQKILQTLLNTEDTTLFDKVKTALQQFT